MLEDWYMRVCDLMDSIARRAEDAYFKLEGEEKTVAKQIQEYIKQDYEKLKSAWTEVLPLDALDGNMARHIRFGEKHDYVNILATDLRRSARVARQHLVSQRKPAEPLGFEALLHPLITEHALPLYRAGHLRESVHTAITAVFDLVRARTGIDADGAKLVGDAFSVDAPKLVFSELRTETGKSDQKGFIQLLQGAYQGIRNPKAHSLIHDLTERKAAEYLVFASLLARRVAEATAVENRPASPAAD